MMHFINQVPPNIRQVFQSAIDRFQLDGLSIHGPGHWMKVYRNAVALADETPGADLLVCQFFALLHDCERRDDGSDPQHGPRAAVYVRELFQLTKLPISSHQLNLLCEACQHHTDGTISRNPTIGICWDADRLDLPRVGMAIDRAYLSTPAAKKRFE